MTGIDRAVFSIWFAVGIGLMALALFLAGWFLAKDKYECHQTGGIAATQATKVNGKFVVTTDDHTFKICK